MFAKLETQNQTVIGALNELNSKPLVPWAEYYISKNNMEKINNPTTVFGKVNTPYMMLVNDNNGDTIFGGGISLIIGYTYKDDMYGAQMVIRYSSKTIRVRNKSRGVWAELS